MGKKIKAVVVAPQKAPVTAEIENSLKGLYNAIGNGCSMIQAVYPWEDMVALVCDEEGKFNGQPKNRVLCDGRGRAYDVIFGTFLIVGIGEEDFCSITDDLAEKYTQMFCQPDIWG